MVEKKQSRKTTPKRRKRRINGLVIAIVMIIAIALTTTALIMLNRPTDAEVGTLNSSATPTVEATDDGDISEGGDTQVPKPTASESVKPRELTVDKPHVEARMTECFNRVSKVNIGANSNEVFAIRNDCFYATQSLIPSIFQLNGVGDLRATNLVINDEKKADIELSIIDVETDEPLAVLQCYWKDYADTCQPHHFRLTNAGNVVGNSGASSSVKNIINGN